MLSLTKMYSCSIYVCHMCVAFKALKAAHTGYGMIVHMCRMCVGQLKLDNVCIFFSAHVRHISAHILYISACVLFTCSMQASFLWGVFMYTCTNEYGKCMYMYMYMYIWLIKLNLINTFLLHKDTDRNPPHTVHVNKKSPYSTVITQ